MKGRKPKYKKEFLLDNYDFNKSVVDNLKILQSKNVDITFGALFYLIKDDLKKYREEQKEFAVKFYNKYKNITTIPREIKKIVEEKEGIELRSLTYLYRVKNEDKIKKLLEEKD